MARKQETEGFMLRLPLGTAARIRALFPALAAGRRRGQAGIGPLLRRWIVERLEEEEAQPHPARPAEPPRADLVARVQALLDDPDPDLRARLERRIALTEDDKARRRRA